MFNIKNRIYVSHKDDMGYVLGDWREARILYLYQGSEGDFEHVEKTGFDQSSSGVVACRNGYVEMIAKDFNGDDGQFHEWLDTQDRLWIAIGERSDYERLFAQWLLELEHTYGLEKEHTQQLLDAQRVKMYFNERPRSHDLPGVLEIMKRVYKPTGMLLADPRQLPLEVVFYLRYFGYVDKKIADSKMRNISAAILKDYIADTARDVQNDLFVNQTVIRLFTGNDKVQSVNAAFDAIHDDHFLYNAFFRTDEIDLHDSDEMKKVIRFCEICIDNEMDYPDEIPRHRGELDMFVKLFRTNDSDLFIQNIVTTANTGFIQGRGAKFNPLLFMVMYDDTTAPVGTFEVTESEVLGEWRWVYKDVDGEVLATSAPYKTETKCREGIRLMKYHTNTAATV